MTQREAAPAQPETSAPPAPEQDDLGLSIDMLDVDRLREWARLLLIHGADISHWASVPHVASKLQTLATGIEHAVRDIGTLRQHIEGLTRQLKEAGAIAHQFVGLCASATGGRCDYAVALEMLTEVLPAPPAAPTEEPRR